MKTGVCTAGIMRKASRAASFAGVLPHALTYAADESQCTTVSGSQTLCCMEASCTGGARCPTGPGPIGLQTCVTSAPPCLAYLDLPVCLCACSQHDQSLSHLSQSVRPYSSLLSSHSKPLSCASLNLSVKLTPLFSLGFGSAPHKHPGRGGQLLCSRSAALRKPTIQPRTVCKAQPNTAHTHEPDTHTSLNSRQLTAATCPFPASAAAAPARAWPRQAGSWLGHSSVAQCLSTTRP